MRRSNLLLCTTVLCGGFVLAAVLAVVLKAQAPAPPPDDRVVHHPDMVVLNGKVVTVDDRSSIQEAVAIRDGRFLAVGTSADMRRLAGPSTRVIDAGGRTVLPGLIDTHVHLIQAAVFWRDEIRVDEARSLDDIFAAIRTRAATVPPGTWILIRGGWHYSQLRERRMPTRAELDAAAPAHPVHVQATYEVVQLNSLGITASGITGQTELPSGGSMEKDAQGNFTGVLRGTRGVLMGREKYFPRLSFEEKIAGLRAVMREFNAAGLTGIIDGNGLSIIEHWLDSDEDYQALFEVWRRGQMTLRVGLQLDSRDEAQALDVLDRFPARLGDDMFWLNSVGENLMLDVWNPASYPLPPAARAAFTRVVEAAVARRRHDADPLPDRGAAEHHARGLREGARPDAAQSPALHAPPRGAVDAGHDRTDEAPRDGRHDPVAATGHRGGPAEGLGRADGRRADCEDGLRERAPARWRHGRHGRGAVPALHGALLVRVWTQLARRSRAADAASHA